MNSKTVVWAHLYWHCMVQLPEVHEASETASMRCALLPNRTSFPARDYGAAVRNFVPGRTSQRHTSIKHGQARARGRTAISKKRKKTASNFISSL